MPLDVGSGGVASPPDVTMCDCERHERVARPGDLATCQVSGQINQLTAL